MDIVIFLTISMLSLSALQIALLAVHQVGQAWPWLVVNAVVLVAGGVAMFVAPQWSAAITGAIFVPFVLAPAIFGHLAQRNMAMNRPGNAARYAGWAAGLHPSAPNRFLATLYRALATESYDRTRAILEETAARVPAQQRQVIEALLAVRRCDWEGVLEIAGRTTAPAKGLRAIAIRALGETGQLPAMIAAFEADKGDLVGYDLLFCQLFVLAFAGRVAAVQRLLKIQLKSVGADTKAYWLGIAEMNATDGTPRSLSRLTDLSGSGQTEQTRRASRRHVEAPAPHDPALLPFEVRAVVAAIERRLDREAPMARFRIKNMAATIAVMALLSAVFVVEIISGGSENALTLVKLGALWPPAVIGGGEWWRLFTCILLHAGWLHFTANMFVLFLLGRFVEVALGRLWLVAGFIVGGITSSAAVLAAMVWGWTDSGILIGASGGIFALFGMEVARQVLTWRHTRDILDARRVGLLAAVMVIQFVIDVSLPEISLTAHLSGFATGLAMGMVIGRRLTRSDGAVAPT